MSKPHAKKENHTIFLLTVGLLAWLIPGAGHVLIKENRRALIISVTIILTFCTGLYIGSIGIINPAGAKPWYVAQILNSPIVAAVGYMAKTVLNSWGIHSTADLGEIVYNLIQVELMKKSDTDRREDFDDVYDFDEVFCQKFKIDVPE